MNTQKRNKGFTLIELLVTVSVIGILATVAVTAYVGSTLKASRSQAYSNLVALGMFEEQFFAEAGVYTMNQANFPGFAPGAGTEYIYVVTSINAALPALPAVPYDGAQAGIPVNTFCYIITATGIAGTRVAGDVFAIDCRANKNF